MDIKVNVMGAEDFKTTGRFFYCTCEDIQSRSKLEILECFGKARRFKLENSDEFEIMSVEPIISIANKSAVLFKVDINDIDIPEGIYPTTAIIH